MVLFSLSERWRPSDVTVRSRSSAPPCAERDGKFCLAPAQHCFTRMRFSSWPVCHHAHRRISWRLTLACKKRTMVCRFFLGWSKYGASDVCCATGEACWWTIHPASKQRSEGEKVRVSDDVILVSVATERYLVSPLTCWTPCWDPDLQDYTFSTWLTIKMVLLSWRRSIRHCGA